MPFGGEGPILGAVQAASPEQFLIGVDTGGTFTDAAVIDGSTHRVLATAKAVTTKGDLAVGVIEAVAAALGAMPTAVAPGAVGLLSVSTTLATNAVVEGHGDEVGVVLVGFDAAMAERTGIAAAFPSSPVARVPGGHDHGGRELEPFDLGALDRAVAAMGDRPVAFAVSATFATRNPEHELVAAQRIAELTGKPVTRSGELSSGLDAPRRALTAVLNARLIGRVSTLVTAVERAMVHLGLDCPLMLVKGDGSVALAATVALRPIETVLSGPAASLVGARWLSGLDDFLLADMGGTTTDLGIVRAGRPAVAEQGAEVGGWRTMVRAVDMRTLGLGGDSEVLVEGSAVVLAPRRVVPLSLAASRRPEVLDLLAADLADVRTGGALHGRFVMRPFGHGGSAGRVTRTEREHDLLDRIGDRVVPLREVAGSSRAAGVIDALRRAGAVQLVGFTPSDAAHVLGLQDTWSTPAAELGAQLGARLLEMRNPTAARGVAFARTVWERTVAASARVVLDTALGVPSGPSPLLDAVCAGTPMIGAATVSVVPTVPLVAVGGPVGVFYPEVGRRLGTVPVLPPSFEVANAVGAATGAIVRAVRAEVHGDGGGTFRVHAPDGVTHHPDPGAALDHATAVATARAVDDVAAMGGGTPEVRTTIQRTHLPGRDDDAGLLVAVVTAEAVGRPAAAG